MTDAHPLSDTLDFGRGRQFSNQKLFFHTEKLQAVLDEKVTNPSVYEISPIGYCNQACFYCCSSQFRSHQIVEQQAFIKVIDQIKALDGKAITITGGGEPLLYPGIENVISHSKEIGLSVGLLTNGTEMHSIVQDVLVDHCSFCRVSLDTTNPKTYFEIRKSRRLSSVLDNLRSLVRKRARQKSDLMIGAQIVWSIQTIRDIENTILEIKNIGVDFLQIRPLDNAPDGMNFQIPEYKKSKLTFLKNMVARYSESTFSLTLSTDKWFEAFILKNRSKMYAGCKGANFTASVGPDNHLYFCCSHISNPFFDLGSLSEYSLEQLLFSKKRVDLIANVDHDNCQSQCRNHVNNKLISHLQALPKNEIATLLSQTIGQEKPLHWEFL